VANSGYYTVLKCSDLYFESYPTAEPELKCSAGGYDFSELHPAGGNASSLRAALASQSPTFARALATEPSYHLPHVAVLTSTSTQSSALILAASLAKLGATIVGVPPGERVNHFGEVLQFRLPNSGLEGRVSSKLHVLFPDDPFGHELLAVDIPLTYAAWQHYDFDRHATVLLALDHFVGH